MTKCVNYRTGSHRAPISSQEGSVCREDCAASCGVNLRKLLRFCVMHEDSSKDACQCGAAKASAFLKYVLLIDELGEMILFNMKEVEGCEFFEECVS